MNDRDWLDRALASMHKGQWFGFSSKEQNYSTLIIHDSSITKPTEAEVNAKIQELKDADTQSKTDASTGKQKLKDLGLNDAEIKSLMGV
tara:strand:- start:585 stop:851 length:267 start_codon:yes stop_codon:yes gene_type:complete